MKIRIKILTLLALIAVACTGCGYTTRALVSDIRTVYIESFRNKIDYTAESRRNIYFPLVEVKVTNAVVDRFLFDGNLKVVTRDRADVILKGDLLNYTRDALRYDDNNDVQEYRITITVSLSLWDTAKEKVLWQESSFAGETEYLTTGSGAKSESAAVEDAVVDLARRIVERTIEDW